MLHKAGLSGESYCYKRKFNSWIRIGEHQSKHIWTNTYKFKSHEIHNHYNITPFKETQTRIV